MRTFNEDDIALNIKSVKKTAHGIDVRLTADFSKVLEGLSSEEREQFYRELSSAIKAALDNELNAE